jgi:hypothetical protein
MAAALRLLEPFSPESAVAASSVSICEREYPHCRNIATQFQSPYGIGSDAALSKEALLI